MPIVNLQRRAKLLLILASIATGLYAANVLAAFPVTQERIQNRTKEESRELLAGNQPPASLVSALERNGWVMDEKRWTIRPRSKILRGGQYVPRDRPLDQNVNAGVVWTWFRRGRVD